MESEMIHNICETPHFHTGGMQQGSLSGQSNAIVCSVSVQLGGFAEPVGLLR